MSSGGKSMNSVLTIARHEYVTNVRRTGFIVITVMVPLIMVVIVLIAAVFGGQAGAFLDRQFTRDRGVVGVVDRQGAFTPLLPEYQGRYALYPDEVAGRAAVRAGEIGLLMVIGADYIDTGEVALISAEGGAAAVMSGDSEGGEAFFVDHLLRDTVDQALRARLAEPMNPVIVPLDGEAEPRGGVAGLVANILVPYFLGLLLIVTLLTSSGYLPRSV